MKADDFIDFYRKMNQASSHEVNYQLIPLLLERAREKHGNDFSGRDFEQSWRSVKGHGLEKLLGYLIGLECQKVGLELVEGSGELSRLLQIDFAEYGSHLPDVDLCVYYPQTKRVLAVLSVKTSLRERATQTGYWYNKLKANKPTAHIKVFFITPNSDDILQSNKEPSKQRAVIESDTDGIFIINKSDRTLQDYRYKGRQSKLFFIDELISHLTALI